MINSHKSIMHHLRLACRAISVALLLAPSIASAAASPVAVPGVTTQKYQLVLAEMTNCLGAAFGAKKYRSLELIGKFGTNKYTPDGLAKGMEKHQVILQYFTLDELFEGQTSLASQVKSVLDENIYKATRWAQVADLEALDKTLSDCDLTANSLIK